MNHALEMISGLDFQWEWSARGRDWQPPTRELSSTITGLDYFLAWKFGERRCGDHVFADVLTIESIELAEEIRGTGICTEFITTILEGDPAPRIPLKVLYFKECGPGLSRLLERLHFHRHPVGPAMDYWHEVTGQKELPL
jgi:hypothetical protein